MSKKNGTQKKSKPVAPTADPMPAQLQKWEKARQVGKTQYIIRSGLVKWSLLAYGLYVLMMVATYKFQITKELVLMMLPYAGLFAVCGVLYGFLSWHLAEKNYQNYLQKRQ